MTDSGMPDPVGRQRHTRPRAPRADALRNRRRLVDAARHLFTAADQPVALEAVARSAGVGIGTLYRHFATREELVEAVYTAELDDVTDSADELLEQLPPEQALRAWILNYAHFISAKRGMLATLRDGWASGRIATPATRQRITSTLAKLLTAGASTGSFRTDIDPEDLTVMLLGIFTFTAAGPEEHRRDRLVDLAMDALRPR